MTVHASAAALATVCWVAVGSGWAAVLSRLPRFASASGLWARQLPLFAVSGVLLYLLATAGHYLVLALERSHEARRHALELEVVAREAQLAALKSQIDPHFLFNCLHSVSALCGRDPAAARRMTERLATFFRSTLRLSAESRVPLAAELDLVEGYLEIESVRFGDRLRWQQDVPEECRDAAVPALLLQPLVENALKHGIAHRLEGGLVQLAAARRSAALELVVDNPCDEDRPRSRGAGVGLANIRRRLGTLYSGAASLTATESDGRFRVVLTLPWEEAADDRG
jgi:LytS/YehU family sensor histidine kinase